MKTTLDRLMEKRFWSRRKACDQCPFRKNSPLQLGQERATEIGADVLLGDRFFYCHKTLDYNYERDDERHYHGSQNCTGAYLCDHNSGAGNLAYRIARMSRLIPEAVYRYAGEVFSSFNAFVHHHRFDQQKDNHPQNYQLDYELRQMEERSRQTGQNKDKP